MGQWTQSLLGFTHHSIASHNYWLATYGPIPQLGKSKGGEVSLLPIGAVNFTSASTSQLDSKLHGEEAFLQAWAAPALRSGAGE